MVKLRTLVTNRLALAGAGLIVLALWFIGVGIFRQPMPAHAPRSTAAAPTDLTTAAGLLSLGDYDFDRGQVETAIADYSRALELNPEFSEAYNNRAYAYMTLQDYARALTDLDRAIKLRPDYVNGLMNRGDIYNYYYRVDYERALADYDRVLALDPAAADHTSVCGHRLLALYHGWSFGVLYELASRGARAGCPPQSPAY